MSSLFLAMSACQLHVTANSGGFMELNVQRNNGVPNLERARIQKQNNTAP